MKPNTKELATKKSKETINTEKPSHGHVKKSHNSVKTRYYSEMNHFKPRKHNEIRNETESITSESSPIEKTTKE